MKGPYIPTGNAPLFLSHDPTTIVLSPNRSGYEWGMNDRGDNSINIHDPPTIFLSFDRSGYERGMNAYGDNPINITVRCPLGQQHPTHGKILVPEKYNNSIKYDPPNMGCHYRNG
jgi:hypothetical protein